MEEIDWQLLLMSIKAGKCTPIIGPDACYPSFQTKHDLAKKWAEEYKYPFKDIDNLPQIAQFIGVKHNTMRPKELLSFYYKELHRDFSGSIFEEGIEPHGILAKLPLPVYITTNYDNCMYLALKNRGREPQRELCKWNLSMVDMKSILKSGYVPSSYRPLVFYFFGCYTDMQSLILTEDDYLKFLINITTNSDQFKIPPIIGEKLTSTSLVFLGLNYSSWEFRVCLKLLSRMENIRPISVTVVIPPKNLKEENSEEKEREARSYLESFFRDYQKLEFSVFWGSTEKFINELHARCIGENLYVKFAEKIEADKKPVIDQLELKRRMNHAFNMEELKILCFNIEENLKKGGVALVVDLENLGGEGKEAKILELIKFMERHGYLDDLVAAVKEVRPNLLKDYD